MSRCAGVEPTAILSLNAPDELQATLDAINAAHAKVCLLMADGPSQVLFHSNNLSSDVQSPPWFSATEPNTSGAWRPSRTRTASPS